MGSAKKECWKKNKNSVGRPKGTYKSRQLTREEIKMKLELPEIAERNERLHPSVSDEVNEKIIEGAKREGLNYTDYITSLCRTFDLKDVEQRVDMLQQKTDMLIGMLDVRYANQRLTSWEGVKRYMAEKKEERKARKRNPDTRIGQFHLRVTEETHEKIKQKAAEYGMTISDFVNFVIGNYDIMDVYDKLDVIEQKLDKAIDEIKKKSE